MTWIWGSMVVIIVVCFGLTLLMPYGEEILARAVQKFMSVGASHSCNRICESASEGALTGKQAQVAALSSGPIPGRRSGGSKGRSWATCGGLDDRRAVVPLT
jgi:hypothetical protein